MRKDFLGSAARVRGDTWTFELPFASGLEVDGAEVVMALRRNFEEPTSVYCTVTNATDAVVVDVPGAKALFRFSREMTWSIDAPRIWYDAKIVTNTIRLTHWYGEIKVLPTGVTLVP